MDYRIKIETPCRQCQGVGYTYFDPLSSGSNNPDDSRVTKSICDYCDRSGYTSIDISLEELAKLLKPLLVVLLIIMLQGCGKSNGQNCTSQGVLNGTPQTITNGLCSVVSSQNVQNPSYVNMNVCGQTLVTQNNVVCQVKPQDMLPSTSGCTPMGDGYLVYQNSSNTQCWVSLKNGQIDSGALAPSF